MVSTSIDLSIGVGVPTAARPARRPMVLTGRLAHVERQRRARRWLAWNAGYGATAVAALALTAGGAQVMEAAMLATLASLGSPLIFVIAAQLERRAATTDYPSGLHRLSGVVMLCSAIVAILVAAWLLADGGRALLAGAGAATSPGLAALVAALYAGVPPLAFARCKRRLSGELYDRTLHADAARDALAWWIPAAVGFAVIGGALGLWWADAVAGLVIASTLGRSGVRNLRAALAGLLECLPRRADLVALDPVLGVVISELAATPWVTHYQLRLREHGAQIAGEILVDVPSELRAAELVRLTERLHRADWRLTPVTVSPLRMTQAPP